MPGTWSETNRARLDELMAACEDPAPDPAAEPAAKPVAAEPVAEPAHAPAAEPARVAESPAPPSTAVWAAPEAPAGSQGA